jgi:hypothetical protein
VSKPHPPERYGVVWPGFELPDDPFEKRRAIQLCFPFIEPVGLLTLINMRRMTRKVFVDFVTQRRPQFLFDVRPVPSFDVGSFSRSAAFTLFEHVATSYHDLAGTLALVDEHRLAQASVSLATEMAAILADAANPVRCIAILIDGSTRARWATRSLSESLTRGAWNVQELSAISG